MRFKPGDRVKHIPTGEHWLIAAVESGKVYPSGWPETMADESDCEMVECCSEEDSIQMIIGWATRSDARGDVRAMINSRLYDERMRGECEDVMGL